MTRGLGGISPANVQAHLKGIHYPASKEDLISTAKRNGAPREILAILEQMPEGELGGPQDVMKAYSEIEGGGEAEGEQEQKKAG